MGENRDLPTLPEVQEFLAAPLRRGATRVLHCKACGAVIYFRTGGYEGNGDPVRHVLWHRELEEALHGEGP